MPTSIIHMIITTDDTADVIEYVSDAIDNANQEWELETATIETDGIITDLLETEEELDDEAEQESDTSEATEEEATQLEDETEEAPRTEPSGKEF